MITAIKSIYKKVSNKIKLVSNFPNYDNEDIYAEETARRTRKRDELDEYENHRKYYKTFFDKCPRERDVFTVLDVACGTGRYFHLFPDADQLIGVDLSGHMLREARTPYLKEKLRVQPALVLSDIRNIPLLPSSFDLVYCIGIVGQEVPFDHSLLDYLINFCVPGGTLLISVLRKHKPFSVNYSKRFRPSTDQEIEKILSNCQAQQLRVETVEFHLPSINLHESFHTILVIR